MAQKDLDEAYEKYPDYIPVIEDYFDLWQKTHGDGMGNLIRYAARRKAEVEILSRELAAARRHITRLTKKVSHGS